MIDWYDELPKSNREERARMMVDFLTEVKNHPGRKWARLPWMKPYETSFECIYVDSKYYDGMEFRCVNDDCFVRCSL